MQRTPPDTTDARRPNAEATTPASRLPRFGAPATCAYSIPDSRPRRWSGVARIRIEVRRTALKKTAPPATPRKGRASGGDGASPKPRIAAPQTHAQIVTASPWRRVRDVQPDRSDPPSAPP